MVRSLHVLTLRMLTGPTIKLEFDTEDFAIKEGLDIDVLSYQVCEAIEEKPLRDKTILVLDQIVTNGLY